MLTRSSVLHYVDLKYGPDPIVGGPPVFARDSGATIIDMARKALAYPRLQPLWPSWSEAPGDERRPSLLLQPARVNRATWSRDLSQWTNTNTSITTGQLDPRGGAGARLLNATSSGGLRTLAITFSGNGTKAITMWLRKGSASVSDIEVWDDTASATRHRVRVTWSAAGVPTLSTGAGSGTLFPVEQLTNGWWAISFTSASITAANTNHLRFYPAGTGATGTCYFDGAQAEDGTYATSMVDTAGAVGARAVDQIYWHVLFAPVALAIYWEIIVGNALEASTRLWHLGKADGSNPYIFAGFNGSGHVTTQVHNGTASQEAAVNVAAVQGDRLRGVSVIHSSGAPRTIVARNTEAAAQTLGSTPSGGLLTALSEPKWWANSQGTSNVGRTFLQRIHAVLLSDMLTVPGTDSPDAVLRELEDFQLSAGGEVI